MFVSKFDLIKLIFVLVCFWPAFSLELLREQVLVNSNQSVILKCTHNLTNVTNARWSYVPHGTNKIEYLYDLVQQSIHKDVKVYCGLGETICNIEIIQMSQKFAGKYLCEVRSGREELKPISIINLAVGELLREQVLVNSNQSILLNCTHNLTNVTNARWSYVPHGTNKKEYLYDLVQHSVNKDVKVYCNLGKPICNIEIIQVSQKFAGEYLCEVRRGREELKPIAIINLVVGDLECSPSGKTQISEFRIGETDCDGIVSEDFSRSCSFLFKGELSQLPTFKWIGWQNEKILITELKSGQLRTGQITASSNIPASSHMDGVTFECLLENQSIIQSYIFPKYSIQYVRNTAEKRLTMNMNDLKTVECSTNKSDEVPCTYSWIHKVDEVDVEIHSSVVTPKQMTSEGTYTCIAKCQFYNRQECSIRALDVIVKSTNSYLVLITFLAGAAVLFLIFLVRFVVAVDCRKLKQCGKRKQDSRCSTNDVENGNVAFMEVIS